MKARFDGLFLGLAAAAALLAAWAAALLLLPAAPPPPVAPGAAEGAGLAAAAAVEELSAEAVRAISARPVFNVGRLPDPPPALPEPVAEDEPPPPPPPAGPQTGLLDELALVGIAISEEGRVALLRREGEERLLRVRPGDTIGEWQVVAVEQAAVVVAAGEETRRIGFRKAGQE